MPDEISLHMQFFFFCSFIFFKPQVFRILHSLFVFTDVKLDLEILFFIMTSYVESLFYNYLMMLAFFFFSVSFKLQAKERQKHKNICEMFIALFCHGAQTNVGGI